MKLKKGDKVKVTAGKDKGREAVVEKVFPRLGKVLVPGVNLYKKHAKAQKSGRPGGIIDVLKPILINKVVPLCPKCGQPTRFGYRLSVDTKIRICKKCGEAI